MFGELGWLGWLFVALGWIVAGLALAWFFGAFARAGRAERTDRSVPSTVEFYKDHSGEQAPAPDPATNSFNRPAKL